MRFRYVKLPVFAASILPAAWLVWGAFTDRLGANPIDAITDTTGDWTLRFLLISLAVTPLRRLTGWNQVIGLRRMLGLFAFFYATLHFGTYLVLDQFFAFDYIVADIAKRPYITVGFTAFVLLVPLAVTSTKGWIRRLGRRWQLLHRLVYVSACLGVVHYLWLVKLDTTRPLRYAAALAALLGLRLFWVFQRRLRASTPSKELAIRPEA
ncbi:MAG: sulfite oxidase heme-binding subunit YedZ [Vicinamibacterales bacterium]